MHIRKKLLLIGLGVLVIMPSLYLLYLEVEAKDIERRYVEALKTLEDIKCELDSDYLLPGDRRDLKIMHTETYREMTNLKAKLPPSLRRE